MNDPLNSSDKHSNLGPLAAIFCAPTLPEPEAARQLVDWLAQSTVAKVSFLAEQHPHQPNRWEVSAQASPQAGECPDASHFTDAELPLANLTKLETLSGVCDNPCDVAARGDAFVAIGGVDGASTHALVVIDPQAGIADESVLAALRIAGGIWQQRIDARSARETQSLSHQQAVQSVRIGLLELTADGAIVGVGGAAAEMLGVMEDSLLGLQFTDLFVNSSPMNWSDIWSRVSENQRHRWQGELLLQVGEEGVLATGVCIGRATGTPRAYASMIANEERKHQRYNEWTQRQLLSHASRMQTLGELVGAIAHEMTQPLGAISNYAAAARTRLDQSRQPDGAMEVAPKIGEQVLKWLTSITELSHSAGNTIDRLRKFSKRSAPHRSTFDLNKLLEEAIQLHVGEAYAEQVQIGADLQDGLPMSIVDEVQLHQVVSNLIRNAFEATEDNEGERRVVVRSQILEEQIQVTVEDNGSGVPTSIIDKIYEPFETTRSDRLGVGLAISKSIIEAHHGRLWHGQGELGGAAFTFALPLAGVSAGAPPSQPQC